MTWQDVLKYDGGSFIVEDGDAPSFGSVQELLHWMENNEDPNWTNSGKNLLKAYDKLFEAHDRTENFEGFKNALRNMVGGITRDKGLRRQFDDLVESNQLVDENQQW